MKYIQELTELDQILSKRDFDFRDTLVKIKLLINTSNSHYADAIIEYFKSYDEPLLFRALVKLTSKAIESWGIPGYEAILSQEELMEGNVSYIFLQKLLNETFLQYFDKNKRYLPLTLSLQNLVLRINDNRNAFLNFTSDKAGKLLLDLSLFYKTISLIFSEQCNFTYDNEWIVSTKKTQLQLMTGYAFLSQTKIPLDKLKKWPDESQKKDSGFLSVNLFLEILKASPHIYKNNKKIVTICFPYVDERLESVQDFRVDSPEKGSYFKQLMDFIATVPNVEELNLTIPFFELNDHHLDYLIQSLQKISSTLIH